MPNSESLNEFKTTLEMAKALIDMEINYYHNPPRINEIEFVRGLRGGASVLIVAAFEKYLKEAFEENLQKLTILKSKIDFDTLPEKMKITSVYGTLGHAMRGPQYEPKISKLERLIDIERACKIVVSGTVNPQAFSNTDANPSSKTVSEMFKNIGLTYIYSKIDARFRTIWNRPVHDNFISDKLDEIVNNRHIVAHTASTLNITRSQLKEYIKFITILATLLDIEISNFIADIIKKA